MNFTLEKPIEGCFKSPSLYSRKEAIKIVDIGPTALTISIEAIKELPVGVDVEINVANTLSSTTTLNCQLLSCYERNGTLFYSAKYHDSLSVDAAHALFLQFSNQTKCLWKWKPLSKKPTLHLLNLDTAINSCLLYTSPSPRDRG